MNQVKTTELEKRIYQDYGTVAGIIILKNGQLQYENYFNSCTKDSRIHVYSVTKSVLSLLIGIAVDKGYLKNCSQKVLDFFPDYTVKRREHTIQNITIGNLLTMTAPYKYKYFAPYIKYFKSNDSVRFTLDLLGGKGQIGKFRYTPVIGPDILSGILTKAAGQPVLDFASEYLFSPLGITVKKSIVLQNKEEQIAFNSSREISGWVSDPTGVNTGGWGLTMAPSDMAKIGQLYLNGGVWNGRQIVPAEWIKKSTEVQSKWENLSYGYLWWIIDEKEHAYAALGDGGNVIYVNERKKLVAAVTSLFAPRAKDRIALIREHIEPIFEDC
ncbi:beta-lactamase family protein [Lacrimispora sp. NSJ-141]|uniref:Beta-lactamase family protein n=1 Tax=Lientehia hominis TaxID=2897778 RepID=A0AAP2W7M6_9FIRM|nr:serine hydrolase [Lientehia hominis]MCD2491215.1 beta-lactamase family protein [Lientehia hominis]